MTLDRAANAYPATLAATDQEGIQRVYDGFSAAPSKRSIQAADLDTETFAA